jgi:hypothetical protein
MFNSIYEKYVINIKNYVEFFTATDSFLQAWCNGFFKGKAIGKTMNKQTPVRNHLYLFVPTDVEGLEPLAELALDARWLWGYYNIKTLKN